MKPKFVKWNDLNQFHEVVKSIGHNRLYQVLVKNDYEITYGLKIKLHGTNAAVRIEQDGRVVAQKRSSDIPATGENAGFRKWVEANEPYFARLARSDAVIIVYGEWAGPGIQSGVAVSSIPNKTFFPFAMDSHKDDGTYCRLYDPAHMENVLGDMPDDMIVIPWFDKVVLDFASKEVTEKSLYKLNALTEQVGENDPFIEELYGTKGCGEGFVCYPFLGEKRGVAYINEEAEHFSHFNFKAKSEHHRVNKTKAAVAFDPEKFANKNRFADAFCTQQRMEQGFGEFMNDPSAPRTMKDTSAFIKWVCSDVFKESQTEQAETPIPWSDLSKTIASRAAIWYKQRVSQL